jgi:hypothetical protein
MIHRLIISGVLIGAAIVPAAAAGKVVNEAMIRNALAAAHLDARPGAELLMRDGRKWYAVRIDKFSIHAGGGRFAIEGTTTVLEQKE